MALEAGRHVLIEKPITVNAEQCNALLNTAAAKRLFVMEGLWTRFQPIGYAFREVLGEAGKVRRVWADNGLGMKVERQFPTGGRLVTLDLAGGGLLDLGIYSLNWVLQALGPRRDYAPRSVALVISSAWPGVQNWKDTSALMAARNPTTKPTILGTELALIKEALTLFNLNGKGKYTRLCEQWLETFMPADSKGKAFVLSSCTSALELAAILANIQPGDEITVPSYTYVSTVNSFVLRGAVLVFVSLDSRTMNIDARVIEAAITSKTRVIVPVHYGGIAADMDPIMDIARRHGLLVVEDAAMACTSLYEGRMLGTIGHIGCISFHAEKNFTAGGQGGALLVNDPPFIDRARIVYAHGTNRSQVDRYQWLDLGTNATLSEVQAAFLYAQLQTADTINTLRLKLWQRYHSALRPLVEKGDLTLPTIPENTAHNGNVF
ncbi:PLP-dependent transferase [Aspergillus violaceofuscus CBS 115571]|uniref:PLP-dependent transferase n=1 Tax=Aspergillus violaceofuscus (strain CBS 115571) TaxID=1450538 RepID=A0A2V5GQJ7_ASPV1|nr:PLP-dependent transferase [Aspergillus violaceofuscus CBS 115571]